MKFFYLAFLFSFIPSLQVYATTPKSVTCTRTEYREEYIPGTKSNPGYVRSYEVDIEIPCGGSKIGIKKWSPDKKVLLRCGTSASSIPLSPSLRASRWDI